MLTDLFSGIHVQNDGTPSSKSVIVSGNGTTVNAKVNVQPPQLTVAQQSYYQVNHHRGREMRQGFQLIAQSTADEPSQPLLAHFLTTIIGSKARSCQEFWF